MHIKFLNSLNGQLKISDKLIISKATKPDDLFGNCKTSDIEVRGIKTGFVHYVIRDVELQEKYFYFSFCFFADRLDAVTFGFKDQPGMLSWDDWSEAKEKQIKVEYDYWLNSEIGMHREFSWGKIGAYFDPKGGGSTIVLRYS